MSKQLYSILILVGLGILLFWISERVSNVPIGESTIIAGEFAGYYESYTLKFDDQSEFRCDAFVVLTGHKELEKYFIAMVEGGNTVQRLDGEGRLMLNLDLDGMSGDEADAIRTSTPKQPITLRLEKKEQEGKGAHPCHSFVRYIGIVRMF